jgi:hypothetical protein
MRGTNSPAQYSKSVHVGGRTHGRNRGQGPSLSATPEGANPARVAQETAMPSPIVLPLNAAEPTRMREQRRRFRLRCPLLGWPLLLRLAPGRSLPERADGLWCSRSSSEQVAARGRQGGRASALDPPPPGALPWELVPSLRRRGLALLTKSPTIEGLGRTRASGATRAWRLAARRG